jgi:hypothetical protein
VKNYFDVIIMNGVIGFGLNHIGAIEQAIDACYAVLASEASCSWAGMIRLNERRSMSGRSTPSANSVNITLSPYRPAIIVLRPRDTIRIAFTGRRKSAARRRQVSRYATGAI